VPKSLTQEIIVSTLKPTSGSPVGIFIGLSVRDDIAERWAKVLMLAKRLAIPLTVEGSGARWLGEAVACALADGDVTVLDVPVGLIGPHEFEAAVDLQAPRALLIHGANLSDIDVYAPRLLARVTAHATGAADPALPTPLVFTGSSGPASLPWPAEIKDFAINLTLARLEERLLKTGDELLREPGPLAEIFVRRAERDPQFRGSDAQALKDIGALLGVSI
jgi:hypothetical protein